MRLGDGGDATLGEVEQGVEFGSRERVALGGALHLDQLAVAVHDHVEVDVGGRVLRIGQVEDGTTVDDADRDRHALRGQRIGRNVAGLHETLACVVQSDIGTTDRRRAGAAVGLEDIAVEPNRRLAERPHVGDRTQRPADESLDLLGTTLCAPTLAIDALGGRTRKHRVLGGDPTLTLAFHPARHVLLDRRSAEHSGLAEGHEARPHGHGREVAGETEGTQFVGLTAVVAGGHGHSRGSRTDQMVKVQPGRATSTGPP